MVTGLIHNHVMYLQIYSLCKMDEAFFLSKFIDMWHDIQMPLSQGIAWYYDINGQ